MSEQEIVKERRRKKIAELEADLEGLCFKMDQIEEFGSDTFSLCWGLILEWIENRKNQILIAAETGDTEHAVTSGRLIELNAIESIPTQIIRNVSGEYRAKSKSLKRELDYQKELEQLEEEP